MTENKGTMDRSELKSLVYELGTDGAFEFKDEEPIRVNRAVITFSSKIKFFFDAFYGPEPKTRIKIKGFDRTSFKLFLDCVLGLKECSTVLHALLIYPIARHYDVKECLEKCEVALKPEVMDERVTHVLNQTTFYKNCHVTDYVVNFIKAKYGIVNFLENKEYSKQLRPCAICILIENVEDLNSFVWNLVFQWGENYVAERNIPNVLQFFMEIGIFERISLSHFESVRTLINFHEMTNRQLLSSNEILSLLGNNTSENGRTLPDKSVWIKIEPGYSLKETIAFKKYLWVGKDLSKHDLDVVISLNKTLIDPEVSAGLKITARYIFRRLILNGSAKPDRATWRSDLNFFYREEPSEKDFLLSAFSPSYEIEVCRVKDSRTPTYKFVIFTEGRTLEIHSVEITYNFNSPCRILTASLDANKYSADESNLYFTKNVTITKAEKHA